MDVVLGYHSPGDYHSFVAIPEGAQLWSEVEDSAFHTHEAFLSLVTAIHEHYHLMQEMLQGFCLWKDETLTRLALHVSQAVSATPSMDYISFPLVKKTDQMADGLYVNMEDPFSLAQLDAFQYAIIQDLISSPARARGLLEAEASLAPTLRPLLTEDEYTLTTLDLLECQAAILTELHISRLIRAEPHRFSLGVVNDLPSIFRLRAMLPQYSKPLRCAMHVLQNLPFTFEAPSVFNSRYGEIENGELYLLLATLIDCALHVPPDPFLNVSPQPDLSALEDMIPSTRFIKLLLNYVSLVANDLSGSAAYLLDENLLYPQVLDALVVSVNKHNAAAQGSDAHGPAADDPNTADTFLTMQRVNELWLDALRGDMEHTAAPLPLQSRMKAVQLRVDTPYFWLGSHHSFHSRIDLPVYFTSGRGLKYDPFWTSQEQLSELDLKRIAGDSLQELFDVMAGRRPLEQGSKFPATLVPTSFMREVLEQDMRVAFAQAVYVEGRLRCPLTYDPGSYLPCAGRSAACEEINDLARLPADNCMLRRVVSHAFCDPQRLIRRGWDDGTSSQ
jgi:hypothetical protein